MVSEYEDLFELIDIAIIEWAKSADKMEKEIFSITIDLCKSLDLNRNGEIKKTVANLRVLRKIKANLDDAIINPEYLASITKFLKYYKKTEALQTKYFQTLADNFESPRLWEEIKFQAVDDTIESLTGSGIKFEVIEPIKDILTNDVTSGSSFQQMVKDLDEFITSSNLDEGRYKKWSTQVVTDSINQYSRNYAEVVTNDLGLEWYQYVGAKVKHTRPLCNALVNKRYIHKSELPSIVKGKVNGRQTQLGSNGLPLGQIPGTTAQNFPVLAGGYRCNHHLIPVDEDVVPKSVREKIEAK